MRLIGAVSNLKGWGRDCFGWYEKGGGLGVVSGGGAGGGRRRGCSTLCCGFVSRRSRFLNSGGKTRFRRSCDILLLLIVFWKIN